MGFGGGGARLRLSLLACWCLRPLGASTVGLDRSACSAATARTLRCAATLLHDVPPLLFSKPLLAHSPTHALPPRSNDNGSMGHVLEDLHGKHVSEVLDTVSEQIRSLPKLFSRECAPHHWEGGGWPRAAAAGLPCCLLPS